MAAVTIFRPRSVGGPVGGGGETIRSGKADNMRLSIRTRNRSLPIFRAPFAPTRVNYSGHEGTYNEVTRPDRKPLLVRSGLSLRKLSMTLFVGSPYINQPFNDELKLLEQLAQTNVPLLVEYDPRTYGFWRITSMSYESLERSNGWQGRAEDQITRAEVEIEFTEIVNPSDASLNVIVRDPARRPKYIVFKKGDTLVKIAQKYYATSSIEIVRAIARANNIKNIKRIKPGKKIKLP